MPRKNPEKLTRDHIDGVGLYSHIREILFWLLLGYCPEYPRPPPNSFSKELSQQPLPQEVVWRELTREDFVRLKLVLDAEMKLLNKVLPELKAVEVHDLTDQKKPLDTLETARRVHAFVSLAERRTASLLPQIGVTAPQERVN